MFRSQHGLVMRYRISIIAFASLLAACQPNDGAPDPETQKALDAIGVTDTVHFTGTEPFWGGQAKAGKLTYQTTENQEGATIAVKRFNGLGGFSYSGTLNGSAFDMMVTSGKCSDGMSDRTYPLIATLKFAGETRQGCAWTDKIQFEEPIHP